MTNKAMLKQFFSMIGSYNDYRVVQYAPFLHLFRKLPHVVIQLFQLSIVQRNNDLSVCVIEINGIVFDDAFLFYHRNSFGISRYTTKNILLENIIVRIFGIIRQMHPMIVIPYKKSLVFVCL